MHEVDRDQDGLRQCDGQRHGEGQPFEGGLTEGEIPSEGEEGHPDGRHEEDHQDGEHHEVGPHGGMVFVVHGACLDQVEQGVEEHPDDVDEVPVQARDLDLPPVAGSRLSQIAAAIIPMITSPMIM